MTMMIAQEHHQLHTLLGDGAWESSWACLVSQVITLVISSRKTFSSALVLAHTAHAIIVYYGKDHLATWNGDNMQ